MTTQLKDKDGLNIYPAVESGSGGGSVDIDVTATVKYGAADWWLSEETGYINSSGTKVDDPTSDEYGGWVVTDYLPVMVDAMSVRYRNNMNNARYGTSLARYAYYDENKTLITGKVFPIYDARVEVSHDFSGWDKKPAYVRFSVNKRRAYDFVAKQVLHGSDALNYRLANPEKKMLKVLLFGNSFTNNTMQRMQSICNDLSIDNVYIQTITIASALLSAYAARLENMDAFSGSDYGVPVGWDETLQTGTIVDVLSHDWDIVSFQQQSTNSGKYSTYEPSLTTLINATKQYCTNPNVRISWLFTWGTAQGGGLFPWSNIKDAVKMMSIKHPDVLIVPVGTAIENARGTSLNASGEMLCYDYHVTDGTTFYQHLSNTGCYIAGCTWYEKVLAPITGKSIYTDYFTSSDSGVGSIPITDANRALCQRCAVAAIENPFEVTNPALLDPDYVAPTS